MTIQIIIKILFNIICFGFGFFIGTRLNKLYQNYRYKKLKRLKNKIIPRNGENNEWYIRFYVKQCILFNSIRLFNTIHCIWTIVNGNIYIYI